MGCCCCKKKATPPPKPTPTPTPTPTPVKVSNPFIKTYPEEEEHYRLAFAHCDPNHSGQITTSELVKGFEWMNENNFGGKAQRDTSFLYVDALRKQGDVDKSLTLDYPEFSRLMKLEKKLFVENSLARYDNGVCSLEDTINILKQAGYVYTNDWMPFLKQYQQATDGLIVLRSVLETLV